MFKIRALLIGLAALSAVELRAATTATSTITPSNTPTITATYTPSAPNSDGIPNWPVNDHKGGRTQDGYWTGVNENWSGTGGDASAWRKAPAAPAITAGDCLAQVSGVDGQVSPTGSVWDQGYVGTALAGQSYDYGRVYVSYNGRALVKSSISAAAGDTLIPGAGGKLTGSAAVSTPGLYTSLSKTPKLTVVKAKTISGTDNKILVIVTRQ